MKSLSGSAAIGGNARALSKDFGRGDLDHHLRRPVGARPHHAAVDADVAGLHAMGDLRPVRGAAEIGHRDGAERAGAGRCGGGKKTPTRKSTGNVARNFDRHASLLDRATGCAIALTELGRFVTFRLRERSAGDSPTDRCWHFCEVSDRPFGCDVNACDQNSRSSYNERHARRGWWRDGCGRRSRRRRRDTAARCAIAASTSWIAAPSRRRYRRPDRWCRHHDRGESGAMIAGLRTAGPEVDIGDERSAKAPFRTLFAHSVIFMSRVADRFP